MIWLVLGLLGLFVSGLLVGVALISSELEALEKGSG